MDWTRRGDDDNGVVWVAYRGSSSLSRVICLFRLQAISFEELFIILELDSLFFPQLSIEKSKSVQTPGMFGRTEVKSVTIGYFCLSPPKPSDELIITNVKCNDQTGLKKIFF